MLLAQKRPGSCVSSGREPAVGVGQVPSSRGQPAAVSRRCHPPRSHGTRDGISRPEAQGGHGQGHSQPAGVAPAAAPALRLRPWKSAPAPSGLGARGGEPQPRPSDSSSGLPAPGPVTPSGGRGWDGTGRAGMGAGEGTAEPAGGFKCGPGRRRQHSRAARSGCRGLSPARTRTRARRGRCRAAAMPR